MGIGTSGENRYNKRALGGVIYYPWLVLHGGSTTEKDWAVYDIEGLPECIGLCDKEGYSFSITSTINEREFYVTEVKPSPEGDNFLLGCYTHYLWSEDKHHMDVKITSYIKNKSTNSCVKAEPKVIGYGDPSAPATEIGSVIQKMTKVVGSSLEFPPSYKEALEQGWVESKIVTESEERVATIYEFPTKTGRK